MIEQVISGGQAGADQAGWRAAKKFGICCSGWMPKGFLTEDGPRPEFESLYHAKEHPSPDYPPRTRRNVEGSDGLLWFGNPYSRGGVLTLSECRRAGIPHYVIIHDDHPEVSVVAWLKDYFLPIGTILMISGNRERNSPGIGEWVENYLIRMFQLLKETS